MQMQPVDLSPKTPAEDVVISFRLAPELGADTVASVEWKSCPSGLQFSAPQITDGNKSLEVTVSSGSDCTIYVISALVTLASGDVREPWVRMPVRKPK